MPLVVYKLGGSLLSVSDLDQRLKVLLQQPVAGLELSAKRPFGRALLVGGGAAADAVRHRDARHNLGADRAHDLAIAAMTCNAKLVAALLRNGKLVSSKNSLHQANRLGATAVIEPHSALERAENRTGERLPRSWAVTSDSIAAFLAIYWQAAALVLVKSRRLPAELSAAAAARAGFVDEYFPRLANRLPMVAWANLRAKRIAIEQWL